MIMNPPPPQVWIRNFPSWFLATHLAVLPPGGMSENSTPRLPAFLLPIFSPFLSFFRPFFFPSSLLSFFLFLTFFIYLLPSFWYSIYFLLFHLHLYSFIYLFLYLPTIPILSTFPHLTPPYPLLLFIRLHIHLPLLQCSTLNIMALVPQYGTFPQHCTFYPTWHFLPNMALSLHAPPESSSHLPQRPTCHLDHLRGRPPGDRLFSPTDAESFCRDNNNWERGKGKKTRRCIFASNISSTTFFPRKANTAVTFSLLSGEKY